MGRPSDRTPLVLQMQFVPFPIGFEEEEELGLFVWCFNACSAVRIGISGQGGYGAWVLNLNQSHPFQSHEINEGEIKRADYLSGKGITFISAI